MCPNQIFRRGIFGGMAGMGDLGAFAGLPPHLDDDNVGQIAGRLQ